MPFSASHSSPEGSVRSTEGSIFIIWRKAPQGSGTRSLPLLLGRRSSATARPRLVSTTRDVFPRATSSTSARHLALNSVTPMVFSLGLDIATAHIWSISCGPYHARRRSSKMARSLEPAGIGFQAPARRFKHRLSNPVSSLAARRPEKRQRQLGLCADDGFGHRCGFLDYHPPSLGTAPRSRIECHRPQ